MKIIDNYRDMKINITILISLIVFKANAQTTWFPKIELGYLKYSHRNITVKPGPNWKGYYLNNDQNAFVVDATLVKTLSNKIFAGFGLNYLNFEGINGLSGFGDIEYLPLSKTFSPLLNLRLGYSHIWNQYEGGTGDALVETLIGINYKLIEKIQVYLKTGFVVTQQSSLIGIKFGLRLR